jgi:hypothetical protein
MKLILLDGTLVEMECEGEKAVVRVGEDQYGPEDQWLNGDSLGRAVRNAALKNEDGIPVREALAWLNWSDGITSDPVVPVGWGIRLSLVQRVRDAARAQDRTIRSIAEEALETWLETGV